MFTLTTCFLSAFCIASCTAEGATVDEPEGPSMPHVLRVGGDLTARAQPADWGWRSGECRVTTPLPEGYPPPTPPGAIDIKRYPSVRRAQVHSDVNAAIGQYTAFWPLFRHIKERDIPMTAPVETDYHGLDITDADKAAATWTMSFLYRSPADGPTEDAGIVKVVDTEPTTVLSIGTRGAYGLASHTEAVLMLRAWLDANPAWRATGDIRTLAYNGPDVRARDRWGEIQIPVTQVGTDLPRATRFGAERTGE